MTDEKVIELAKQAGFYDGRAELFWAGPNDLQRFAQLVRNEALAEPAPAERTAVEPVMWAWQRDDGSWYDASATHHSRGMKPLYASPPPPAEHGCKFPMCQTEEYQQMLGAQVARELIGVPLLSDEEMWQLWNAQGDDAMDQVAAIAFARAIEQLVHIKFRTEFMK